MSKRPHHLPSLLVRSSSASFQRNSDEEEGDLSFSTPPPGHLITSSKASSSTWRSLLSTHTCGFVLFWFVLFFLGFFFGGGELNHSQGCAQRGSGLRDIWTRSTVVCPPLRAALMRKFLVSHEGRRGSLCQDALPFKKKKNPKKTKTSELLWSELTLHQLMLDRPQRPGFWSLALGRVVLSPG